MKSFRRFFLPLISAVLLIPLTGCWNYREVESLSIVSGIAVDCAAAPNRYRLTFEVLEPSSGSEGKNSMKPSLVSAEGATVAEAVKNAARISKNELYFSDCKITVFSHEVAEEGLTPMLDWFNRDPGPRFTMLLFVARSSTAAELFQQEENSSSDPVSGRISEAMELATAGGLSPSVALYQADEILLGEGKELLLPCLRELPQSGESDVTQISGCAVFRGDRCVDYLSEAQTKTDLLALTGATNGLLLTGEDGARNLALQIQKSSVSIKPLSGTEPAAELTVAAECTFNEENTAQNLLSQLGTSGVEQLAKQTLVCDLAEEITRMQTGCGCDIYGFGQAISRQDPASWKNLGPRWQDVFRTLKVTVTAKIHINNSGFAYPKGRS